MQQKYVDLNGAAIIYQSAVEDAKELIESNLSEITEEEIEDLLNGLPADVPPSEEVGEQDISIGIIKISYQSLKDLRDNSLLIPGLQYLITDYQCTTTQEDTQAANNQFDIIVVADSENELNENARACRSSLDTYFEYCDLSAWELKYCIDNDSDRFMWADTEHGKGVIYYMKDEYENECPYDFKNILFKRYKATVKDYTGSKDSYASSLYVYANYDYKIRNTVIIDDNYHTYFYTFTYSQNLSTSAEVKVDITKNINSNIKCFSNVIKPTYLYVEIDDMIDTSKYIQALNNIVFINDLNNYMPATSDNFINEGCTNITLYNSSVNNNIGIGCYKMFLPSFCNSIINNACSFIEGNLICDIYAGNIIGMCSNHLYVEGNANIIGTDCYDIHLIGDQNDKVESNASNIKSSGANNYIGKNTKNITLSHHCVNNVISNGCQNLTLGSYTCNNTFEPASAYITTGTYCYNNHFGNRCAYLDIPNYTRYLTVHPGCEYITINKTGANNAYLENVILYSGLKGTSADRKVIELPAGDNLTEIRPANAISYIDA